MGILSWLLSRGGPAVLKETKNAVLVQGSDGNARWMSREAFILGHTDVRLGKNPRPDNARRGKDR